MPTTTKPATPDPDRLPVVAIVGRPNVGKSALFNRLLGRRLAIVHEECGVTRDRIATEAAWQDRRFELVDTGGLTDTGRSAKNRDTIASETRQQAETAIGDATAVIFVVDAAAGVSPLDEEVARLLHRKGARVVVAANKCDIPRRDDDAAAFEALGFPVCPVSAAHNRGVDDLMTRVAALLPAVERPAATPPLRIAIVGRPNVGKSSFINRLVRTPRMIVSDVPGTTRDSVDVPFSIGQGPTARRYVLTDTAGMRQIRKVDSSVERFSVFRAEKAIQNADVAVLVLDAAQGPTSQDKAVADAVLREQKGCVIVVNKWDLMTEATEREYREALGRALPFLRWVPVVFVSAVSGYNIRNALEAIDQVAAQIQAQLPTGLLNRVITEAWDRVQPPRLSGKRFKVYYATQVGTKPVRIALFVNDPERLTDAYRDYLINTLRRHFGLEGAPVALHCKSRPRPERPGHPSADAKP